MALRLTKREAARGDVVDDGGGGGGEEKKKEAGKAIFLCADRARKDGKCVHVWYQLRIGKEENKRSRKRYVLTSVDQAPPSPLQVRYGEISFVSLGSVIYMLGRSCLLGCGNPPLCDKHGSALFCDTHMMPMRWIQGPFMRCRRVNPASVAFKGKIYVFGGCPLLPESPYYPYPSPSPSPSPSDELFGEVLDPKLEKWERLPNPPKLVYEGARYARSVTLYTAGCSLNGRDVILLHCIDQKELYAYDVDGESWTVVESNYGLYHGQMVVLDDVLYTHGAIPRPNVVFGLHAYDLVRRKFLSIRKAKALPFRPHPLRATLLDIGNGVLALADLGIDSALAKYSTSCFKFRVVKVLPASDSHATDPTITLCDKSSLSWLLPADGGRYSECYVSANLLE